MERFRRMMKKPLWIMALFLCILLVGGCGSKAASGGNGTPSPITHDNKAGQVVIQLFRAPGFMYPPMNGVPEWTLYGDGTLLFKENSNGALMQTRLSPGEVQHILDVVVNQDAFFASTQDRYGHILPDAGSELLSVNANGQQKEVRLFGEPSGETDQQTAHVFAIQRFLLSYQTPSAQPYNPPGVALLVIAQQNSSGIAVVWPYANISLSQAAAQECALLPHIADQCASKSSGVLPIGGKVGQELLQQYAGNNFSVVTQDGKIYQIIIWPLLPDAFTTRPDGSRGIKVEGAQSGIWPLLPALNS